MSARLKASYCASMRFCASSTKRSKRRTHLARSGTIRTKKGAGVRQASPRCASRRSPGPARPVARERVPENGTRRVGQPFSGAETLRIAGRCTRRKRSLRAEHLATLDEMAASTELKPRNVRARRDRERDVALRNTKSPQSRLSKAFHAADPAPNRERATRSMLTAIAICCSAARRVRAAKQLTLEKCRSRFNLTRSQIARSARPGARR